MLVSFPLAGLVIHSIRETNYEAEVVVYAADVGHDVETPAAADNDTASTEKVSA